ncbi:MAG: hypothetical protein MJZ76_02510 [Bacteroidales bacterium]|nr:hypothetical protein [Bacteroidales bacterium]
MKRTLYSLLTLLIIVNYTTIASAPDDSLQKKRPAFQKRSSDALIPYWTGRNSAIAAFASSYGLVVEAENNGLLKEMMGKRLMGYVGHKDNIFLMDVSHWGYSKFGELETSIGYTRLFAHKFAIGIRFYYLMNYAFQYESQHSLSFDISFYYQICQHLGIGGRVFNPAHLRYGLARESSPYLPMIFNFDLHYSIGKKILFFTFVDKTLGESLSIGAGIAWIPLSHLIVQGCFSFPNATFGLKTVLCWKHLELGIEMSYGFHLGVSPALSLFIPIKTRQK